MKKLIYLSLAIMFSLTLQSFSIVSIDCVQWAHDATAFEEQQLGVNYDFNTYLEVMNEWNTLCEASEQQ